MEKATVVVDSQILNNLQSCAYKTLLRQESQLERIGVASETLETGTLMHLFLEKYNVARFDKVPRTEAVDYALNNVPFSALDNYKALDARDYEIIKEKFIDYTNHDEKHKRWIISSLPEKKHIRVLFEDDAIRIVYVALIDVEINLNGVPTPVDYKTEKRKSDPDKKSNQFIGYCWIRDVNHMIVAKIGLQKSLPPSEKYRTYNITYTNEEIAEWKREVIYSCRQLLGYYATEYWPKNRTSCFKFNRMCAFAPICEAPPSQRNRVIATQYQEGKKWNPLEDQGGEER